MRHRQHAVLAIATLALAGWLASAAQAAELIGPSTMATPSACAAPALQLAPPPMLTPATAATEPLVTTSTSCNCGVLSCLDAAKGTVVWRKDSKSWPGFYVSSSPLIQLHMCWINTLVAFGAGST